MAFSHGLWGDTLGAALKAARGFEALDEFLVKVDGSSFFKDKFNVALSTGGQNTNDANTAAKASLDAVVSKIVSSHSSYMTTLETWLTTFLKTLATISDDDVAAGMVAYSYDPILEAQGQISILKASGFLPAVAAIMTADSKVVQKNVITFGAVAAAAGNKGVLVESTPVAKEYALDGTLTFTCTDDTIGATRFSVENILSLTKYPEGLIRALPGQGATDRITADKALTLGQSYQDGQTGASILLSLGSLSVTGQGANPAFSAVVVSSPNERDSNKGQHFISFKHILVGGAGPNWRISWYRSNGRDDTVDRVTYIDITGETGSVSFTMIGAGATITGTFSKANAMTDYGGLNAGNTTTIFDIVNPRKGDAWTKSIANDEAGNFQAKTARRYPFAFPSDTAASAEYAQAKAASLSMT